MRAYFIRHAETNSNKRHVHQRPESDLSELGVSQANKLGEFFLDIEIDALYTSDFNRTINTANKISEVSGIPLEKTETLREIRRPNSLYGTSHFGPKTFSYVLKTVRHHEESAWHYEDGESLFELNERAELFVKELERISKTKENVVVVSHAIILELIIARLCNDGDLGWPDYFKIFSPFSTLGNASITTFDYSKVLKQKTCSWLQISLNDTSHLKG